MFLRIPIVGAVSLLAAGCSNATSIGGPQGLTNANLQPVSPAAAAETIDIEAMLSNNKTMAGKVLTAIALERVTGRKPDPARLTPTK